MNYITLSEACDILGCEVTLIKRKCIAGKYISAKKVGNMWFVDKRELKGNLKPTDIEPFDYIPIKEFAKQHNLKTRTISTNIKSGLITNAKMFGKNWFIHKDEIYFDRRTTKLSDFKLQNKLCNQDFSNFDDFGI